MHTAIYDLPEKVIWSRRGMLAKFTPDIEPYFARYHERELLQRSRLASLAAALAMSVFMVLDLLLIPATLLPNFLWVRCVFVITPLLALWLLSYTAWGQRHLQLLGGMVAITVGLAMVTLIYIARRDGALIEYEGIILTLFYFYCCGGLRLKWALPAGLIVGLAYPIVEYRAGLNLDETIIRGLFLAGTNAIGAVSALMMEHATRRNFAQTVQLQALAHADPLTGLLNRRALDERIQTVWRHASREHVALHIAMIDVDYFKQFNDHYGHAAGDQMLRQLAKILQCHTQRPLDLVARYGGEEFVCIWFGGHSHALATVLHNVLNDLHDLALPHAPSPIKQLSLSIGAVRVFPHRFDNTTDAISDHIASVLSQADALLYRAKAQGRNCAVWAADWLPTADSNATAETMKVHTLRPSKPSA